MNYVLSYTSECGTDIEVDIQAKGITEALVLCKPYIAGGEGLLSSISISGPDAEYLEFDYSDCMWRDE